MMVVMDWEFTVLSTIFSFASVHFFLSHRTIVADGFMLVICVSVHFVVRLFTCLPVCICFPDYNLVNINEFSSNLVCALILWWSGLGLLMGKFRLFLTVTSAVHRSVHLLHISPSIFSFMDDNLKKHWIFSKLSMCIDIVDIWFNTANGQNSSIFTGICPPRDDGRVLSFFQGPLHMHVELMLICVSHLPTLYSVKGMFKYGLVLIRHGLL